MRLAVSREMNDRAKRQAGFRSPLTRHEVITTHHSPGNPAPEERFLDAGGGVRLWVRRWRAETDRTLILTHGLCEHSGRHEHIVPLLHERGWNVVLWDLRGHGRSTGRPRTHVERFEQYVSALDAVRADAASPPERTVLA
ncbi:MAG: alpha/beta hydrolase, partial [Planctomycetaceae bacterium]